jgi:hypothetical protein
MPHVDFSSLPDTARAWVFAADASIADPSPLLAVVDAHLDQWAAHGVPLVCAREWSDDRFLVIGVDEAATGASGCSIDGLFRILSRTQVALGADLVSSGRVAWRNADGEIRVSTRTVFEAFAEDGVVHRATPVFSTLAETVGEWRAQKSVAASESWASGLLPVRKG